jgi:methionine-gamma-lyase
MNKDFPFTGYSSLALHASGKTNADDAHLTPIYASSTFTFGSAKEGSDRFAGADKTRIYSRWGNPTFTTAEETIAALESFGITDENGQPLQLKSLLHASGQAAMTTLFLSQLKAGDTVLSHYSLYGGTHEILTKVLSDTGIKATIIDMHDLNLVRETLQKDATIRLVHVETPANPTIQCVDIEEITKIAKEFNCIVSVDNTFATPYLQQPFRYGVDFVFHSTTKFLNGHGTAIGGVLLGRNLEQMKTKVWKWHALLGGNSNPFDAFLLTQGLKTLELRMERHCHNAMEVAEYLNQHPAVAQVNYTGLTQHPDYAIAAKQMRHPGALMSVELKGGLEAGRKFTDALQMCTRAVSLGTLDTLVSHPATMSHMGLKKEEREQYGITDGLIRMSIGIENIADLLTDLEQALRAV